MFERHLFNVKGTSAGWFEGESVNVLQSENPPETSQTSKDSPTAICPFGNSSWCPGDVIGPALCSSNGLSFPSHRSNVSDLKATIIFICAPEFPSTPATVTSSLNGPLFR
jgi:hypothetical protein